VKSHLHESPAVVTVPLILLAIPSAVIGWITAGPVLFGNYFGDAIVVDRTRDVLTHLGETIWHGSLALLTHAPVTPVFWLAAAGVFAAWFLYLKRPDIPETLRNRFSGLYTLLDNKYYFDDLWIRGFGGGGRAIGDFLWKKGDQVVIDGVIVNGTANSIGKLAGALRHIQTGYLYTYAFAMIIGLTMFLGWLIWLR
jgi:NADH-quinone oxidoreductase subunit L